MWLLEGAQAWHNLQQRAARSLACQLVDLLRVSMPKFAVILPAAGRSQRFGDQHYKKPFVTLGDRAVWLHAVERFVGREDVCQLIVVIAEEDREMFHTRFGANLNFLEIDVCIGGKERCDSVAAALQQVHPEAEFVAIHDAARPAIDDTSIDAVFAAAAKSGAAMLASPVTATVKRGSTGEGPPQVLETVPRQGLWLAHTPQVFSRDLITRAYADRGTEQPTDDAQLVERLGHAVTLVEDSPLNIKITTRRDLKLAELILKTRPAKRPEGFSHPFANDDLWR